MPVHWAGNIAQGHQIRDIHPARTILRQKHHALISTGGIHDRDRVTLG
jgi:hypothetical protein